MGMWSWNLLVIHHLSMLLVLGRAPQDLDALFCNSRGSLHHNIPPGPCHPLTPLPPLFLYSRLLQCSHRSTDPAALLPLLNHYASALEVWHVSQSHTLIPELFAWESSHQHPFPGLALRAGRCNKSVNVSNRVAGVEP